jgi:hypothetical protein
MPLIILTVIIQACFIFHVFKTGRPYWWAFVILSFPVVGCTIYYFVEVFPGSREHRAANRAARELSRTLNPHKALRERIEALETAPTVDNRVALARELMRSGRAREAAEQYREARTGLYANDPELMLGLAQALLADGDHAGAHECLDQLQASHQTFRPAETGLLRARVLEALGDTSAALEHYERLAETAAGLEVKVRHAQLLKRLGHATQADVQFQTVIEHARRFNVAHEEELAWTDIARAELNER